MKQFAGLCKRPFFLLVLNLFLCLPLTAQNENTANDGQAGQDLRAVLYFVMGNDKAAAGTELPRELADAAREIKSGWNYTALTLAGRQLIKTEAPGVFKSRVSIDLGNDGDAKIPISISTLDWVITLKRADGGTAHLGACSFSIRTPVRLAKAETSGDVFNYEAFNTSMSGLSVRKGVPTLIGSLSLPAPGGTLFVILTLEAVTVG